MRPTGRPGDSKSRRVTPPSPSYMNNEQFATYLSELRSNRVTRPGGARPPPVSLRQSHGDRTGANRYSLDAVSISETPAFSEHNRRKSSQAPSIAGTSMSSRYSNRSSKDYYPTTSTASAPLRPSDVVPTATYMERGQRWMEKEEVHSLRDAMQEMGLREGQQHRLPTNLPTNEEEHRIHNAALDEAAELVFQHQNPGSMPQPDGPYRYKPHLRKNSYAHARTASASSGRRESGSRSVSGSSTDSDGYSRRSRSSVDQPRNSYGSASSRHEARRRSSMRNNISGEFRRPFSGDQIWEEPETSPKRGVAAAGGRASPEKLSSRPHNPLNRVRFEQSSEHIPVAKPLNYIEIHQNPPSQTRNGMYVTNPLFGQPSTEGDTVEGMEGLEIRSEDIRSATGMRMKDRSPRLPQPTAVSDRPGRPIVSFDANWKPPGESTDNSLDRRSLTPPAPNRATVAGVPVSVTVPSGPAKGQDSDPEQQRQQQTMVIPVITVAEEVSRQPSRSIGQDVPSISVGPPEDSPNPVPTINVPVIAVDMAPASNAIPSINVPSIAVTESGSSNSSPIPAILAPGGSPSKASNPRQSQAATPRSRPSPFQRPRGHWSPAPGAYSRSTTVCHECNHPIEGRSVALAGCSERFHPNCFNCFTCGTALEALEISPEPDQMRAERLDRIRRRAAGETLTEEPGMTMAEDGDSRLRFFCHLDWHELFAPRCKHCTTPILGEHIVALGEHWHYGHFFCAECGDPFEHGMTHIEKDGYAWCIKCQTKRTERRAPKCRKCGTAVIGEYVQALDAEWHEKCFRCAECRGAFDDGQIFPKDIGNGLTVVLCTRCMERELKI